MRFPAVALFSGILIAGALIAGCGGGGGGASNALPPSRAQGGNATVQVRIVIPQKTVNGRRRPAYISPSTQSVMVLVVGPVSTSSPTPAPSASPTIPPVLGIGYANFSPTSSNCTNTGSGLSCNVTIAASISSAGTYGVLVYALDQPQTSATCISITPLPSPLPSPLPTPCAGNVVGEGLAISSITPGTNTPVNITLGGIPIYVQPIELVSGLVGGNGGSGSLTVFGPGTSQVSFQLLDADKNIIAGMGSLSLAVSSLAPANLTATVSTPDPTGLYTLSMTPVTTLTGGQNVVSAGSAMLSFTPSFNTRTGMTSGPPFSLPVTVKHSVIYAAKSGGQIDAYLDGNTTSPAYTVYGSGSPQLGLAVNPNDESLWVADSGNNDIVVFPLGLPGAPPPEQTVFCGIGGNASSNCTATGTGWENPTYVSFDDQGDAYVSTYNGSIYQVQQYNVPAPNQSPNPSTGPLAYAWNGSASMYFCHSALDNGGHLYVGTYDYVGPVAAFYAYNQGTPTGTQIGSNINLNGVAWAPDGTLWYLNEPASGTDTATKYNVLTTVTLASITGIANNANQGMAVDPLGNVYIATGAGTGVVEWTAASNWTASMAVGNSASPTYVAVYPDGLFGSNHQIGVAQPGQSPVPIASPFPI